MLTDRIEKQRRDLAREGKEEASAAIRAAGQTPCEARWRRFWVAAMDDGQGGPCDPENPEDCIMDEGGSLCVEQV